LELLAALLRLPSEELSQALASSLLADDIRACAKEAGRGHSGSDRYAAAIELLDGLRASGRSALPELRYAYTALFTHPERPLCAPYESLFLHWRSAPGSSLKDAPPLFISPAALSAERIYKQAGLRLSAIPNEPADHIATELEFASKLLAAIDERALGKAADGADAADAARLALAEFIHYHVKPWWGAFFDRLVELGAHPFYTAVGLIGQAAAEALLEGWDDPEALALR
jgi:TorA maturation chaperone TorD